MKVSLVDVDGHHFPNLALMKLSSWHKTQGDLVDWYSPLFSHPERIYASKVFTYTPDFMDYAPDDPEPWRGGTGYDPLVTLPDEVEATFPNYSLYPAFTAALGFLTRGCIRECPWCVVPRKEGHIRIAGDVEQISAGRKEVVLLDNNFLAAPPEFVDEQLGKAHRLNLRLDFNQALDARLVNEQNAPPLAAVKWSKYIRFACDTAAMLPVVAHAVELLRTYGYRREFFIYVLAREVTETHERILKLTAIDQKIVPFCQPYRDFVSREEPPRELRDLTRWCNFQAIRKTVPFSDYKNRKTPTQRIPHEQHP